MPSLSRLLTPLLNLNNLSPFTVNKAFELDLTSPNISLNRDLTEVFAMECKSLGCLVKFVGGCSFKSEKYVPSGLRVIRIANVQDGILEDNAPCYYLIEYKDMIGDALLKEGDLLMSLTGNVGRVAFMTDEFLPAGLNQRVACFRTDDDIMKKYLFYMFKSKIFIQEALKKC